jgi:hypothetical protein
VGGDAFVVAALAGEEFALCVWGGLLVRGLIGEGGGRLGEGGKRMTTYGIVVAEADVAVYVDAALAGFDDGWDYRGCVEGRRDNVDALLGVTQGR